jgi:hypothetical protein
MPEHIQSSAECNAVDVIYESFVVPGDQDYLMSRLMAQKGFPRGFFWAAAQATEKYFKAFLIMNDVSVVKGFQGHPIKTLFEAVNKIDSSFADLSILPHQSIPVEPSVSHLLKRFTIQSFIDELEKHGHSDNRYNTIGVDYNTGHLFAMDSLAFQIREKIGANPINKSFEKFSPDLMVTIENHNPWFQTSTDHFTNNIPCDEFPIQYSSNVTKFEILTNNKNNPACNLALQWLRTKMKLPK